MARGDLLTEDEYRRFAPSRVILRTMADDAVEASPIGGPGGGLVGG